MKRILLCLWMAAMLCSCASALCFTDALGRSVEIDHAERVVSLYHSYGDAWRISGGSLAGSVQDDSGSFDTSDETANLGSHLHPNMELLFALEPDFVLLSADVSTHREIAAILEDAQIPCALFSTPDHESYMDSIRIFTQLTGREDLYLQQLEAVERPIQACIEQAQALPDHPTALLIRAHSTAVKARGSEGTVAGEILKDMGFINLADSNGALSDGISMEAVLAADPDYIFVILQGSSSEAAERSLASVLTDNPAWNTLSAVQNGRFIILDRALFHYHPNAHWAQAYEFILNIRKGTLE